MKLSKKLESDKSYHLTVRLYNKKEKHGYSIDVLFIGTDSYLFNCPEKDVREYFAYHGLAQEVVYTVNRPTSYSALLRDVKHLNEESENINSGYKVDRIQLVQESYRDQEDGEFKIKQEDLIKNNPEADFLELRG